MRTNVVRLRYFDTGWPRSYRKYILQITQPSLYGYAKLHYRFAVTSGSPSMVKASYLDREQSHIWNVLKKSPVSLHTCATCSELPSNINAMMHQWLVTWSRCNTALMDIQTDLIAHQNIDAATKVLRYLLEGLARFRSGFRLTGCGSKNRIRLKYPNVRNIMPSQI